MSKKSILEEALLQVQTLEEAVKANAKGILASTMKEELNDLLKEQEDDIDPEEEENDVAELPADDETSITDETPEIDEPNIEDEVTDEIPDVEDMVDEPNLDGLEDEVDDDVLDMTGASDEEVLKVFKSMKPEDGIVVKKDGDNIELSDGDEDYIIKLDDEDAENSEIAPEDEENIEDDDIEDDLNEQEDDQEDDVVYEIELGDDFEDDELDDDFEDDELDGIEDELDEESQCDECGDKKIEASEAARTKWNPHGDKGNSNRAGIKGKKVFKAGALNEEVEILKKQNAEYKKGLLLFKEKLNEVAVFNANLAYATRLFTEHSTTKKEKLGILKRFDSISTITESKNLYKLIKTELDDKRPVTESTAEKIISTPKSSSTEMLSESKAYENPQFTRMKELMNKIK